ncbi:MAG TPA: hypothetical protein VJN93_13265 [Candidatus Acidoferrum sp.]|nr:hypothetical protein [Candidatus Acidoferrum sp.]
MASRSCARQEFGAASSDWSSVPVAVPYANLTNPQTLNLYSMVSDDPESFADLDGHGQQQDPSALQVQCQPNISGCTQQQRNDLRTANANQQTQTQTQAQAAQQQARNQSQTSERARHIAERLVQAGEGLVNLTMAQVKVDLAVAQMAVAPESGFTAVTSAYTGVSAAGSGAAGAVQLLGAATGRTEQAEKAAEAASTVASAAGFIRTIGSGSIEKGAKWAKYEAIITTKPAELFKGRAVEVTAKVVDFILNAKGAAAPAAH